MHEQNPWQISFSQCCDRKIHDKFPSRSRAGRKKGKIRLPNINRYFDVAESNLKIISMKRAFSPNLPQRSTKQQLKLIFL